MSFSASITAGPADKFEAAVSATTIPQQDEETQALFAKGQAAIIALAKELPQFGSGTVNVQGSISGHAFVPGASSYQFNSLAVSVGEVAIPVATPAENAAA